MCIFRIILFINETIKLTRTANVPRIPSSRESELHTKVRPIIAFSHDFAYLTLV